MDFILTRLMSFDMTDRRSRCQQRMRWPEYLALSFCRTNGFVVLPKRWIVERTLAWLNRCRRLAKDWESRNRKALAFLHLASIRLMQSSLKCPDRL
jgi:transposase